MHALDLFAGSGWGVACQRLGILEHGVEIMPEAVATREAAGMSTAFRDVWDGLADPGIVPAHDLQIASPPCQSFSMAGNGAGRRALDDVLAAIDAGAYKSTGALLALSANTDPRTALVLSPLAYAFRFRPTFIAWEQVPTVLPVWEACADVLRSLGYSVAVGNLQAEQYGVPQTRKRAFLVARNDGPEARLPSPTHSRYYSRNPEKLDEGVLPWVSMAEAIGWGLADRPAPTITSGSAHFGSGAEWGGGSVRKALRAAAESGDPARWTPRPKGSGKVASKNSRPHNDLIRISASEAGVLQTFPADHPWRGSLGKQLLQSGNAVPPLLAEQILRAVTATPIHAHGVTYPDRVAALTRLRDLADQSRRYGGSDGRVTEANAIHAALLRHDERP